MLLARKGYRVLLLDRATFPSDTISTHIIWQSGVSRLRRWGLLDQVVASGCPSVTKFTFDLGDYPLSGWGPPVDGVSESFAPRRTVLDKILVDAAADSGAEVREGFSVREFVSEGNKVTGVRGKAAGGQVVTEKAHIVVGADGRNSSLARAVEAPVYDDTPSLSCLYYTYWSGVPMDGYEDYWPGRQFILTVPTNYDQVLIVIGWPHDQFHMVRIDIEANYMRAIDLVPRLSERVRAGRREERFLGSADVGNFFRKPYGPGWALVGDAGHSKDPITAFGISDAFRDAELLVDALDEGLSGRRPFGEAMADYERRRNEAAMPLHRLTLNAARYNQHTPNALQLRAALRGGKADTDAYIGVITGSVSREEFFSERNLQRILSGA